MRGRLEDYYAAAGWRNKVACGDRERVRLNIDRANGHNRFSKYPRQRKDDQEKRKNLPQGFYLTDAAEARKKGINQLSLQAKHVIRNGKLLRNHRG